MATNFPTSGITSGSSTTIIAKDVDTTSGVNDEFILLEDGTVVTTTSSSYGGSSSSSSTSSKYATGETTSTSDTQVVTNTRASGTYAEPLSTAIPWYVNTVLLDLIYKEDTINKSVQVECDLSQYNRKENHQTVDWYYISVPDVNGDIHTLEYELNFDEFPYNNIRQQKDTKYLNIYPYQSTTVNFIETLDRDNTTVPYIDNETHRFTYSNTSYNTHIKAGEGKKDFYSTGNILFTTNSASSTFPTYNYLQEIRNSYIMYAGWYDEDNYPIGGMCVNLNASYTTYENNTYVNTLSLYSDNTTYISGYTYIMPTGEMSDEGITNAGLIIPTYVHTVTAALQYDTDTISISQYYTPDYINIAVDQNNNKILYTFHMNGNVDSTPTANYNKYSTKYSTDTVELPTIVAYKTGYSDLIHTNNLSTIPFDWADYDEEEKTYTASITTYLCNPNDYDIKLDDGHTFQYVCSVGSAPVFSFSGNDTKELISLHNTGNIVINYSNATIYENISGKFSNVETINGLTTEDTIDLSLYGLVCNWRNASGDTIRFTYQTTCKDEDTLEYHDETYTMLDIVGLLYTNTTYSTYLCTMLNTDDNNEFYLSNTHYLAYNVSSDEYTVDPVLNKGYKNKMIALQ